MEFLVSMTTLVPEGVSASEVDAMKEREAAHTRQLAAQGRVLRLWRPPLQPEEWRTLGLFDAETEVHLEEVLTSMPLRPWRTDTVTALAPHSNDPGRGQVPVDLAAHEFFTVFHVTVPPGTSADTESALAAAEARRTAELAGDHHLVRLWTLPGEGRNLGLWQAADASQLADLLDSLPMSAWLDIETTPLTRHPSDPAGPGTTS
jgi:muconolactone delta-isomerase